MPPRTYTRGRQGMPAVLVLDLQFRMKFYQDSIIPGVMKCFVADDLRTVSSGRPLGGSGTS